MAQDQPLIILNVADPLRRGQCCSPTISPLINEDCLYSTFHYANRQLLTQSMYTTETDFSVLTYNERYV